MMELVGARIPPQSYHGPHFERSEAQDELWNQRGSNKAWDPLSKNPMISVPPGPESRGRAHTIDREELRLTNTPIYTRRILRRLGRTGYPLIITPTRTPQRVMPMLEKN